MKIRILRVIRPTARRDLAAGVLAFVTDTAEHRVRYRVGRGWQCSTCQIHPCNHIEVVADLIDEAITAPITEETNNDNPAD